MKLRFDKNSLRLRLKKSDIAKLRADSTVEEIISFPGGFFCYRLISSAEETQVTSTAGHNTIEVIVPHSIALSWMDSEEVGIYGSVKADGNNSLSIIIEKDFPCKEQPGEDVSDTFTELASKDPSHC
jgi:hypothetical protein